MYKFIFSINERELMRADLRNSWDERSLSLIDTLTYAQFDRNDAAADTIAAQNGDSYAMLGHSTLAYTIEDAPGTDEYKQGYNGALNSVGYWHLALDDTTQMQLYIGNADTVSSYENFRPAIFAESQVYGSLASVAESVDCFLYTPVIDEETNAEG